MQIIVAILSSTVITTLITEIFATIRAKRAEKTGYQQGVRLILKNDIRNLCLRYIDQSWIYADELEDLMAMHSCYHTDLGGNGYLDELMNEVKKLPIKGRLH